MVLEATPLSVASDGNMRVAVVPTGSNPLSVAVLGGVTTKSITFSLTGDGYNRAADQASIADPRLASIQDYELPGTTTETLELTYIFGDTNDVAAPALTPGTVVQIVDRRSIPNSTDWTIGQKADVLIVKLGLQRKNAPAKNSPQTMTQKCFVIGATKYDQALVA